MGSKRLPDKATKNLCGQSVIEHIIERLLRVKELDGIVLATTDNSKDDILEDMARKWKIGCFRGPESDVLGRLHGVALQFKADAILRITGDSPLIDLDLVNQVALEFRQRAGEIDFLTTALSLVFPEGCSMEVVSQSLLDRLNEELKNPEERESFMIHISRYPEKFHRYVLGWPKDYSHIRLTLDYPEDFELVKKIYEHFFKIGKRFFSLSEAVKFLDANPALIKINQHYIDKTKYPYNLDDRAVKKAI